MTKDQKIIRAKAGLIELAKQLGDVSQACKIMGFEPGQLLPVQGSLRQRRGTGASGDVAPPADPEEPGAAGDRDGGGGDGDRPAGLMARPESPTNSPSRANSPSRGCRSRRSACARSGCATTCRP